VAGRESEPYPAERSQHPSPTAFGLRFCGFAAAALIPYYFARTQNIFEPFLSLLATLVGGPLNLTGAAVVVSGRVILVPGAFGIDIGSECSGISHLLLFCSAVLAYPSTFRSRMLGVLLGAAAVSMVNLVRLTTLLWACVHAQRYFDFIHSYVWGFLGYLGIVLLWFLWMHLSDKQ
jgi:exosortase/archaeosortase family protein